MAGTVATNTVTLTYEQCQGTFVSTTGGYQFTTTVGGSISTAFVPTTGEIANALASMFNTDTDGYENIDTNSIAIGNGTFSFDCRYGDPILSCTKDSCDVANTFGQQWVI